MKLFSSYLQNIRSRIRPKHAMVSRDVDPVTYKATVVHNPVLGTANTLMLYKHRQSWAQSQWEAAAGNVQLLQKQLSRLSQQNVAWGHPVVIEQLDNTATFTLADALDIQQVIISTKINKLLSGAPVPVEHKEAFLRRANLECKIPHWAAKTDSTWINNDIDTLRLFQRVGDMRSSWTGLIAMHIGLVLLGIPVFKLAHYLEPELIFIDMLTYCAYSALAASFGLNGHLLLAGGSADKSALSTGYVNDVSNTWQEVLDMKTEADILLLAHIFHLENNSHLSFAGFTPREAMAYFLEDADCVYQKEIVNKRVGPAAALSSHEFNRAFAPQITSVGDNLIVDNDLVVSNEIKV